MLTTKKLVVAVMVGSPEHELDRERTNRKTNNNTKKARRNNGSSTTV